MCHYYIFIMIFLLWNYDPPFAVMEPPKKMDMPLTFEVETFNSSMAINLEPERCGGAFSIHFLANDDYDNRGAVILRISFLRKQSIVAFDWREERRVLFEYGVTHDIEWFKGRCLTPPLFISMDSRRNTVVIGEQARAILPDSDRITHSIGTDPARQLEDVRIIVVDGDVDIFGYQNFALVTNQKLRLQIQNDRTRVHLPTGFHHRRYRLYVTVVTPDLPYSRNFSVSVMDGYSNHLAYVAGRYLISSREVKLQTVCGLYQDGSWLEDKTAVYGAHSFPFGVEWPGQVMLLFEPGNLTQVLQRTLTTNMNLHSGGITVAILLITLL